MTPPHSPIAPIRPRTVWLVLMALTLFSFAIVEGIGSTKFALAAIFMISAIKADQVVVHYMEVKAAEPNWQPLYRIWIAAITTILILAHIL